jgi:hypothetical protein
MDIYLKLITILIKPFQIWDSKKYVLAISRIRRKNENYQDINVDGEKGRN